jgi:hypothetical protein
MSISTERERDSMAAATRHHRLVSPACATRGGGPF